MDTLVLSRSYEPIGRITWQRAVTLLFEGKIEVVESYEDRSVRSVTLEIKIPSIVRFLNAVRAHKKSVKFSRAHVYARDGGRCQYCGNKVPLAKATYDHVNPRVQGGHTRWENVVIACMPCNQKKGGRTPEQAKMKLLSLPVKPKKLPDQLRITIHWKPGMPESWRTWLRDVAASIDYWHGELEND